MLRTSKKKKTSSFVKSLCYNSMKRSLHMKLIPPVEITLFLLLNLSQVKKLLVIKFNDIKK